MSVALAATTGLDPAAAIALAGLRRQADSLAAVCLRLDHALGEIPRSTDGTWRGPASSAYDGGLLHLRRLTDAAALAAHEALAATRLAISVLAGGGS